jgi:hypothetical protein
MSHVARIVGIAWCFAAALAAQDRGPDFGLSLAQRAPLERAALEMSRKGALDEALETLEILRAAGHDPKAADAALLAAKAAAAKAGPKAGPPDAQLVRAVKDAAKAWAAELERLEPPQRAALAALVLRLDDRDEAHAALGRVKDADGRWTDPAQAKRRERRGAFVEALTQARRLPVDVAIEPSEHPLLVAVYGKPGNAASASVGFGRIEVHSNWPAEKTARVLRESLRLYAFSKRVAFDALDFDDAAPLLYLICDAESKYKRALEVCREKSWIDAEESKNADRFSAFEAAVDGYRVRVSYDVREGEAATSLFLQYAFLQPRLGDAQPCLFVGHCNWAALAYLGETLPNIAWTEESGGGRLTGRDRTAETEAMLRLGRGGVAGARAYLAWLAGRGEDPAWSHAIVDQVGKVEALDRLKATFVAEFLHEDGAFARLAEESKVPEKAPHLPAMIAALKRPLAEFEAEWRRWIAPGRPPIAARLAPAAVAPVRPEVAEALATTEKMRRAAFAGAGKYVGEKGVLRNAPQVSRDDAPPLTLDAELSDGCRRHAAYLARYPDQAASWPEAHEERPDREGFSPEGARAGAAGVIAPGSRGGADAVRSWAATFYHRLPLLDPGLIRIGFGLEGGVAVLDCGTYVAPYEGVAHVLYPHDGMTDVPLSFQAELPHPVPGEDESQFGFPVTLQSGRPAQESKATEPTLALAEAAKPDVALPAHVSTPSKPTNPDLAPANAYCLMPKARLKPKTAYVATATWPDGSKLVWSFTTAAR